MDRKDNLQIGLALNHIAMSVDDETLEKIEPWLNRIEEIVLRNTSVESEDAISKQAVLEVIKNYASMLWEKYHEPFPKSTVMEIMQALPPVTPQQRWIPVSERLPNKTGLYLISDGDLVASKSFDGDGFRTESAVRFMPDAWMPLPKPYMGESEE